MNEREFDQTIQRLWRSYKGLGPRQRNALVNQLRAMNDTIEKMSPRMADEDEVPVQKDQACSSLEVMCPCCGGKIMMAISGQDCPSDS